jgi:hypothetical protein
MRTVVARHTRQMIYTKRNVNRDSGPRISESRESHEHENHASCILHFGTDCQRLIIELSKKAWRLCPAGVDDRVRVVLRVNVTTKLSLIGGASCTDRELA